MSKPNWPPVRAEQSEVTLLQASVTSNACVGRIRKTQWQGCCLRWAPSYSLAQTGAPLVAGEKAFVKQFLRLPGRVENNGVRYTFSLPQDQ